MPLQGRRLRLPKDREAVSDNSPGLQAWEPTPAGMRPEGAPHVARPSKIISKGGDRNTFGCPYSTSNPRAGVFLHGNLGLGAAGVYFC